MPSIDEVKSFLNQRDIEVWEYDQPTPTAETAAIAVGCATAEIAKTLLFFVGGKPLVVVTCGDMKVGSSLLKQAAGLSGKVKFPQAEEVRAFTGYSPGGVCPFLLPDDLPIYLDLSIKRFERVYAAAGNDASAVPLTASQLQEITAGQWVEVCLSR